MVHVGCIRGQVIGKCPGKRGEDQTGKASFTTEVVGHFSSSVFACSHFPVAGRNVEKGGVGVGAAGSETCNQSVQFGAQRNFVFFSMLPLLLPALCGRSR